MKAINDLFEAMQKRRAERRAHHAVRNLEAWILRDVGLYVDHTGRMERRL